MEYMNVCVCVCMNVCMYVCMYVCSSVLGQLLPNLTSPTFEWTGHCKRNLFYRWDH